MAVVTIVVTVYNRARYIEQALDSALAQTFRDIEVLVVDDNSTDDSAAIADRVAARDPRVRVIRNARNLGQFPNRNHAAGLVRTPYFKFHDSDDVMYPHCIEVMLGPLQQTPQAGLALSASRAWTGAPCPMLLAPRESYQREFLGTGMFYLGPAAALFRTDVFHRLGGYNDIGIASDVVFWLTACREVPVLLVPTDLFFWRQHGEQESRRSSDAFDQARAREFFWHALSDHGCPLTQDERELARRNYTYSTLSEAFRRCRNGRFQAALWVVQWSGLGLTDWLRYLRRPVRTASAGTPSQVTDSSAQ